MSVGEIILKLKGEGHRITPIRKKILDIFSTSPSPISAPELVESFKNLKIDVNKTTIYRELNFLMTKLFITEVEFGDGKKRYELNNGHHHHLICLNCNKIKDVDLKTDLSEEETKIEQETGFKVKSHSLEFFGHCKNCQK